MIDILIRKFFTHSFLRSFFFSFIAYFVIALTLQRPASNTSQLESDSQFVSVEDPSKVVVGGPSKQSDALPSARERRRWKQLEQLSKSSKVHHTISYHIIPYHTTLLYYITTPYHTTPYHTTPYYTTPYHTTPYHTTPHHTTLHYTILHHTTLHHTTLHHTTPHYTIPHHTTPYYTTPYYAPCHILHYLYNIHHLIL